MVSENFEARLMLGVGILLIGFPWFADWLDEPYLVSTASRIWIYALAAMSLNLLVGFAGLVSFGHSAYVGVGAYVVGINTRKQSFWGCPEPWRDSSLFHAP